jgi:hypothetical protein
MRPESCTGNSLQDVCGLHQSRARAGCTHQATAGVRDHTSPQRGAVLYGPSSKTVALRTGRRSGSGLWRVQPAQRCAELVLKAGASQARVCSELREHRPDLAFFKAEVPQG